MKKADIIAYILAFVVAFIVVLYSFGEINKEKEPSAWIGAGLTDGHMLARII